MIKLQTLLTETIKHNVSLEKALKTKDSFYWKMTDYYIYQMMDKKPKKPVYFITDKKARLHLMQYLTSDRKQQFRSKVHAPYFFKNKVEFPFINSEWINYHTSIAPQFKINRKYC